MTPRILIKMMAEHNIENDGMIIVGANVCRETRDFKRCGFNSMVLFEPMPDVFKELYDRVSSWPSIELHNCAISNYVGKSTFYVASNSVSSSLMKPKDVMEHQNVTVDDTIEVDVTTLDEVMKDKINHSLLIIDAEGSELNILKGATKMLERIKMICVELNFCENYEGCSQHEEVIGFLESNGFTKIAMRYGDRTKSYGDAVFIKS